jgi:hypothetical protein
LNRLYFVEQGINTIKLIIEIKKIESIQKSIYKSGLLHSRPAVRIIAKEASAQKIYICVKGETQVWYLLLNEILSATKISLQLLDTSLIQYAARNILLADALLAWYVKYGT